MTLSRSLILALLALALGLLLGRWRTDTGPQPATGADPVPVATAMVDASTDAGRGRSEAGIRAASDSPVSHVPADGQVRRPGLAFDSGRFLAELPGQLDAIAKRAQAGELGAISELADWLDYCDQAVGMQRWTADWSKARGDLADPMIAAHFQQLGAVCTGWFGRQTWLADAKAEVEAVRAERRAQYQAQPADRVQLNGPTRVSSVLRRRAADAGDELSRSLVPERRQQLDCGLLPPSASIAERREQSLCVDRAARKAMRLILQRLDPRELERVPEIIGAYSTNLWNQSEFLRQTTEVQTARVLWIMAACQFGLNCSASGRALREACMSGICGYAQYWDYATDRLLPPNSARLIQQQLPRLVALIQVGDVDAILGPPMNW